MSMQPVLSPGPLEDDRSRNGPLGQMARVLLLVLACLVAWLMARPYEGIAFDAQLYTLQAIASSKPFPLAGDIFLRFGSQTDFTIFPRTVSYLFDRFGIESGAAIVVIASYSALLVGGWWLSRNLTDARAAWLSVGLLITLPGWYGALDVFRYDEMYLSARVPAEALAVFAIGCACVSRWWLALVLAIAAGAIHPVMAAPAWGLLLLLIFDRMASPHWGDRATIRFALVGTTAVLGLAYLLRPDGGPDHEQWMDTLRARTSYAFLQNWRIQDWLQNLLPLATLVITSTALETRLVRRLSLFAALIGIIGLGLAAVASNIPGFERLLLAQSWRWIWLSRFIAIVLLPGTVLALLRAGQAGRPAGILLASGWALFAYSGGAIAAVAAVVWLARDQLSVQVLRALRVGSNVVAIAAISLLVAFSAQAIPLAFDNNIGPIWVQRLIDTGGLDGPPALAMVAIWWILACSKSRVLSLATGVVLAICLAGLVGYQLARFEEPRYSRSRHAEFEAWRRIIPPSAEVLWLDDPTAAWAMLERKSYLSVSQSAGLMYSPLATKEFLRRSQALAPLADPGFWTLAKTGVQDYPKKLTSAILVSICREPTLDFVVSPEKLPDYSATATWPSEGHHVFLYDCTKFRGGASL